MKQANYNQDNVVGSKYVKKLIRLVDKNELIKFNE